MATINFFWMSDDQACGIDPITYHFYEADVQDGAIVRSSVREYLCPECISAEEALELPVLATYSGRTKPAWFFQPDAIDASDLYANYD